MHEQKKQYFVNSELFFDCTKETSKLLMTSHINIGFDSKMLSSTAKALA